MIIHITDLYIYLDKKKSEHEEPHSGKTMIIFWSLSAPKADN